MSEQQEWAASYAFVDTAIGGVNKRNNVIRLADLASRGQSDAFTTWCRFTDDLQAYTATNLNSRGKPSVSKYPGPALAEFLPFDFDREDDPALALDEARDFLRHVETNFDIPRDAVRIYFSGMKGFSLEVPSSLFDGFEPGTDTANRLRVLVENLRDGLGLQTLDTSIYENLRLWRLPNTKHGTSGLYKVPLTPAELFDLDIDAIRALAAAPREIETLPDDEFHARPELAAMWAATKGQEPKPDPASTDADAPITSGHRHAYLLRIAGAMRRQGVGQEGILAALRIENERRCDPAKDDAALVALAADVASRYEPEPDGEIDTGKQAKKKEPSQATRLIKLATDAGVDLFHDGDDGYATILLGGHRETFALESKAAKLWLRHLYYGERGGAASAQAITDALAVLNARARFDGAQRPVSVRTAWHEDAIYIDLDDEQWRAVEVTAAGWRVVDSPPVRFRRPGGIRPLPAPVSGGTAIEIGRFLNITDESDCRLCLSWLVGAMYPSGPYAILILNGEQGAAKSVGQRTLRRLIDPNKAELRSEPRSVEDLMIGASNGWVLSFDNLSSLRPWLSDAFCRIATGGGFSTRTLYENSDETIFEAQRPIILNGIVDFATRDDLNDRAVTLTLPSIAEEQRRPEADVWRDFDASHPRLFGAVLDALALSLRDGDVRLDRLPRMADFARRAYAAAPALGWDGPAFIKAYTANRKLGAEASIEASAAVGALLAIITASATMTATAGEFLQAINERVEEKDRPRHDWPKSPRAMTGLLTRYGPALRRNGVAVKQLDRTGNRREWRLTFEEVALQPSRPSQPSYADSETDDDTPSADRHESPPTVSPSSRDTAPIEPNGDGRDGDDGIDGRPANDAECCADCGAAVWCYDIDGRPYCEEHDPAPKPETREAEHRT